MSSLGLLDTLSLRGKRTWVTFVAYLSLVLILLSTYTVFSRSPLAIGLDSSILDANITQSASVSPKHPNTTVNGHFTGSKAFIVASITKENTSWVSELFPHWDNYIYVNDDPKAPLHNPNNQGREATTYFTYLIDHYDTLPDIMLFIHGMRYQWHNEDPMYDGVPVIQNLQLPYVQREGYANLRCTWDLGCPAEVHPNITGDPYKPNWPWHNSDRVFAEAYAGFFPNEPIPEVVGTHCCAQFAVTKAQVHKRPLSDYQMFRNWIHDSGLAFGITGRMFEYMWHIIFGQGPINCPNAASCFCDKFGLCDLNCKAEGACKGRSWLPPFDQPMDEQWPERGQGERGFPKDGWWLEVD